MSLKYNRGWCVSCRQYVRGEKKAPSHILHLILAVLTGGFWLIVWLFIALWVGSRSYLCPTCGHELDEYKPKML